MKTFLHKAIVFSFALIPKSCYCQDQVILKTIPENAIILNSNNVEIGRSPFSIKKSDVFPLTLKVYMDGYDTTFLNINSIKGRTSLFSESLAYCEPCKVIFIGAPVESKSIEREAVLELRKVIPERNQLLMLAIDTPKYDMPFDALFGTVNGSKKNRNDDDISRITGFVHNIDLQLLSAFENAGILASFYKVDSKDQVNLYKPKIIFQPIIKDVNFQLKGKLLRDYTGPCSMICNWQISLISDPKKIIATIPIQSSFYRTGDNYELVVHQLIWESQKDLLENDTLFNYLVKMEKEYLNASITEPISILRPTPLKFTNNKEMIKEASKSVVIVEENDGFGSGYFISPSGYLITNYHVVSSQKDIKVKLPTGEKLDAEIIRVNRDYDVALLKVKTTPLACLEFMDQSDIGDDLFAIGTPLGKDLGQTITKGIISGYREFNGVRLIQTDVSINEGSSGGPLLNESGKVVGMSTMKAKGAGIEGIGFGIPANLIIEKLGIKFTNQ